MRRELISAQPIVPLNWSSGIDRKTGRPIVNLTSVHRYPPDTRRTRCPSSSRQTRALAKNGMVSFANVLKPEDAEHCVRTSCRGPSPEQNEPQHIGTEVARTTEVASAPQAPKKETVS